MRLVPLVEMPVTLALELPAPVAGKEPSIGVASTPTYAVTPPAERRVMPVPGGFSQLKTYGPVSPATNRCQYVATVTVVPFAVVRIEFQPFGATIVSAVALICTVT